MRTFEYKNNKWYEIIYQDITAEQYAILNSDDESIESLNEKSSLISSISKRRLVYGNYAEKLNNIYQSTAPNSEFELVDIVISTINEVDFFGLMNYRIGDEYVQKRIDTSINS